MPVYKNVSGSVLVLKNGKRLQKNGEVNLPVNEASAYGSALQPIGGAPQPQPQLLTEAPIAPAEPVIEEVEVQPTVKVDVDGDGKTDLEVKGSVVEEKEEKEAPQKKTTRKSSKVTRDLEKELDLN